MQTVTYLTGDISERAPARRGLGQRSAWSCSQKQQPGITHLILQVAKGTELKLVTQRECTLLLRSLHFPRRTPVKQTG